MEDSCEDLIVETFTIVGFVGDLFDMLWPWKLRVNKYTEVATAAIEHTV